jgi:hypothetical protein
MQDEPDRAGCRFEIVAINGHRISVGPLEIAAKFVEKLTTILKFHGN